MKKGNNVGTLSEIRNKSNIKNALKYISQSSSFTRLIAYNFSSKLTDA